MANENTPRTVVHIDKDLHRELRIKAAVDGVPITTLADIAVRRYLKAEKVIAERKAAKAQERTN